MDEQPRDYPKPSFWDRIFPWAYSRRLQTWAMWSVVETNILHRRIKRLRSELINVVKVYR